MSPDTKATVAALKAMSNQIRAQEPKFNDDLIKDILAELKPGRGLITTKLTMLTEKLKKNAEEAASVIDKDLALEGMEERNGQSLTTRPTNRTRFTTLQKNQMMKKSSRKPRKIFPSR